jgi:Mrp family chromosome partitioning ATPase
MGKLLDALNRTGPTPAVVPAAPPPPAADEPPADDEPAAGASFIEVGPRRSIEASPDVLAAAPPPRAPAAPFGVAFRPAPPSATPFAAALVAAHDPDHAVSGQYRRLLAAVCAAAPPGPPVALLFCGARGGAGATTALLNLAVTAAKLGRRRVLVIDAHLARPAAARLLGVAEAPGLRDALAGALAADEAVRETALPGLFVLPAGGAAEAGPRLLAETPAGLVRRLRQRFDLVLIDGPAWDGRPDGAALAAACDAVFLVAPEADADTPALDALCRSVTDRGARLGGCVLTTR